MTWRVTSTTLWWCAVTMGPIATCVSTAAAERTNALLFMLGALVAAVYCELRARR